MNQNTKLFAIIATIIVFVIVVTMLFIFRDSIFSFSPNSPSINKSVKNKNKTEK